MKKKKSMLHPFYEDFNVVKHYQTMEMLGSTGMNQKVFGMIV